MTILILHLLINEKGDLLGFEVTPGNTDDCQPLWRCLVIDSLETSMVIRGIFLKTQGIDLIYKVRKNMKPLDLSISNEVWRVIMPMAYLKYRTEKL